MYYLMREGIEDFKHKEVFSIDFKKLSKYDKFKIYNPFDETYKYIDYTELLELCKDWSINQYLIFTESRIFLDKYVRLLSTGWIDADFYLLDLMHSFENYYSDLEFNDRKFRTVGDKLLCEVTIDLNEFLTRYIKLRIVKG